MGAGLARGAFGWIIRSRSCRRCRGFTTGGSVGGVSGRWLVLRSCSCRFGNSRRP